MSEVIEFAKLTWPESVDAVKKMPVCIIPLGAIEPHGLHLPLDTDCRIGLEKCRRVCAATGMILMPQIPIGQVYSLYSHAGAMTFKPETLISVLNDIIMSCHDRGSGLYLFTAIMAGMVRISGKRCGRAMQSSRN